MRLDLHTQIIIQDPEMFAAVEDSLLVMLAVYVYKTGADALQNRDRHCTSVDSYDTSSVFTDLTKKDEGILLGFDPIFFKKRRNECNS